MKVESKNDDELISALQNKAVDLLVAFGWNVAVIGEVSIEQRGSKKFNKRLVIDFTGSRNDQDQ